MWPIKQFWKLSFMDYLTHTHVPFVCAKLIEPIALETTQSNTYMEYKFYSLDGYKFFNQSLKTPDRLSKFL